MSTIERKHNVSPDVPPTVGPLVALRRRLHRIPEVGLDLPLTQRALLDELEGLPVRIELGRSLSSIAVAVEGRGPGPTVLLRSDMDALPVEECTGLSFASTNGAMHACGHDLHMASLVGAIRQVYARRDQFDGTVLAVFQPGEEGHEGAARMIDDGVLEVTGKRSVVASYGLHVFSFLPSGRFAVRAGIAMAGTLNFEMEVIGSGGHAAHPHAAQNPILAGTLIVQAIQGLVIQRNRPGAPIVATVGAFTGGTAANVIPDRAVLKISLRAVSVEGLQTLYGELVRLARSIASAYGMEIVATPGAMMAPTVNDDEEAAFARDVASSLYGEDRILDLDFPEMIAEDFSEFLTRTGGAFVFVGAQLDDPRGEPPAANHSPRARFDDAVVDDAAAFLAELAVRRLAL